MYISIEKDTSISVEKCTTLGQVKQYLLEQRTTVGESLVGAS
jgi:hypothetical protein